MAGSSVRSPRLRPGGQAGAKDCGGGGENAPRSDGRRELRGPSPRAGLKRNRYRAILAALLVCLLGTLLSLSALWLSGFDRRDLLNAGRVEHGIPTEYQRERRASDPVSVVQPQPIGTDSSVSEVPVRLVLAATHLGRNSREGYADIGTAAVSPQRYRAGALLANGARVAEIHADHVVLTRDGQEAQLAVQGHGPADLRTEPSSLLTVGGARRSTPAIPDSQDALTDRIRIAPVFESDALHALEVYPGVQSEAFGRLGLQQGDRITAIDGAPVSDQARAMAELRRLTEGAALLVTVERGAGTEVLALDGSRWVSAQSTHGEMQGVTR